MDSCQGDYYSERCRTARKSGDIFNDYLDIMKGMVYDASKLTWRLDSCATSEEYHSWEIHMQLGFKRCYVYDSEFDEYSKLVLAHQRMDADVASWWSEEMEKGITYATWEDLKKFLRACFMPSSDMVPSKAKVIVVKQPPTVVQRVTDVGKRTQPLPKVEKVNKVAPSIVPCEEKIAVVDNVEENVPLSGLNVQLKCVRDDNCMTVHRVGIYFRRNA